MLAHIYQALKPEGRLVIVEYYKTPGAMANGDAVTHIRLNKPDVIKEVEANHFRLVSEREQIKDSQYMLVLEKN
jgi:predicted methyltransferase